MDLLNKVTSKDELIEQLKHIGLQNGQIVEVHSSLKSLGYIIGGAQSVVDALLETVGHQGTIVMSSQNADNSEPLFWQNPPLSLELMDKVRDNIPAYDVNKTQLQHMGAIVENLRARADTFHSYHPSCGFIANGKDGKYLMSNQTLNFPFSNASPLGKMYQMDNSYILLIGVSYDNCTAMHYGECLSETRSIIMQGGAVNIEGKRCWEKYLDYDIDSDEFVEIGKEMEKRGFITIGKLANAEVRFFKFKDAVDFTNIYLKEKYR